jgi:hypothetical protein
MVKDDLQQGRPERKPPRSFGLAAGAVALGVVVLTGFLMGCWVREPGRENEPPGEGTVEIPTAMEATNALFRAWPKPDLAILLSGEEHGYLQPCGCSRPQYGGLARRYNFIRTLKEKGWPVVPVDVGDIAQRSSSRQAIRKYKAAMEARLLMDYLAVGIGPHEINMPLFEALGNYALNNEKPRVLAANLIDRDKNFPGMVRAWEVSGGQKGAPKIGVVGVVGTSVADKVQDPDVRLAPPEKVLPAALQDLHAQQAELLVLLFHGTLQEAKAVAARFPQFHIVLHTTRQDEPAGQPEKVGNTLLIEVGWKGRYVGVVGAYRTGRPQQPFDLRYQLACMVEDYETPAGKDDTNPIHKLLDAYARDVRDNNYLAGVQQNKHEIQVQYPEARYVGSEKCKRCHEDAYKVWKTEIEAEDGMKKSHSHAFASLVQSKRPENRQFDPECVQCHVTGYGYLTGFRSEKETAVLKDVGCEVCHGPGSPHIKNNNDVKALKLMNPYKTAPKETEQQRQQRINGLHAFCQKCHDIDNDVHFKISKWEKIAHPEPKQPQAQGN